MIDRYIVLQESQCLTINRKYAIHMSYVKQREPIEMEKGQREREEEKYVVACSNSFYYTNTVFSTFLFFKFQEQMWVIQGNFLT